MPVYEASWKVVVKRHGARKDWIVHGSKKEAEAFEARKRLEIEARRPGAGPPRRSDLLRLLRRPVSPSR